jgi:hypothetical protein
MAELFPVTLEVLQKVKCGQNLFRKPTIERMLDEFFNVAEMAGVDVFTARRELPQLEYHRPLLTEEEKDKVEAYARRMIEKNGYAAKDIMIIKLCFENFRLVKEANEHRAARGIDPLPVFEVS